MSKTIILFFVLPAFMLGTVAQNNCEIIAHRGASFDAPENTLASMRLAWQMECPAAECDIHLTKDHRIVVIHDPNIIRTSDGVKLRVSETNSSDLRKLDIGVSKAPSYKGEKIPFLEEVIETIPHDRRLVVEIKTGSEIIPHLQKILDTSGKRSQIILIGFSLETVALAKKTFPDIPVYWLVDSSQDNKTQQWIPYHEDLVVQAKAHFLDGLDVHYGAVNSEFVQRVHNAGMKLYVWTVDDPKTVDQMRKFGVDGITTNRPDLFLKPSVQTQ